MNKENIMGKAKNGTLVLISCLIMGLNLNSFVHAAGLYPGGFNGLTLLIQRIAQAYFGLSIPFTVINYPLNFLLLAISVKVIGKRFTFYTAVTIILTGIFADAIPTITITEDVLLSCVFGGIINGLSVGICLLAKSSGGGTDIIGILISSKFHKDPWNYVLMGNVAMLVIAGLLFGWNQALYSIIFQFTSTQVLQMLYQKFRRHTLFVVTNRPTEVYDAIERTTHHGATVLNGIGCYENEDRSMIYSVVSSMEVKSVVKAIKEVDKDSFINAIKTDILDGRFIED